MVFKESTSERGAAIVVFALTLTVILLFCGLALDTGNLYRAHIALQNAADAASLSGVGYTARRGKFELDDEVIAKYGIWANNDQRDQKVTQLLEPKTNEVARAVMTQAGFPHMPSSSFQISAVGEFTTLDPTVNPDVVYEYRVTVTRNIDFLIMDLIPLIGRNFQDLRAVAKTERKVANVMAYLDVSDSMNCPASGSCDCMTTPNMGPCATPTKMDELIDAVKTFVKKFDPGRDRLYMVPFNVRGVSYNMEEAAALENYTGPLDELTEQKVDAIIEKMKLLFSPEGSTNICDALMRGRERLERDGLLPGTEMSHVLFTDGAPTAGRFLLSNPKAALPAWSRTGSGGTHDYLHYSVEWREVDDPDVVRYGPGVLIQTDLLRMNWDDPFPPADGSGETDGGAPSAALTPPCSKAVGASPAPLRPVSSDTVGDPEHVAQVAEDVLSPCLNNFGAHLPGDSSRVYGTVYGLDTGAPGSKSFTNWQEQYYNCAIQLTDQFRQEGIVYVIGLGTAAQFVTDGDGDGTDGDGTLIDAYQNSADVSKRHDIFNTRLADDQNRALARPQLPSYIANTQPYPEWGYDGYQDFDALERNLDTAGKQGTYLATPDPSELRLLFENIAQRILLRMTE